MHPAHRCDCGSGTFCAERYDRAVPRWSDCRTRGCGLGAEPDATLSRILWGKLDGTAADGKSHHAPNEGLQTNQFLTERTRMPSTVYISDVIDAPIEKVWSVMR